MAFEAYSVAIKLSLTNMVSSGLGMIAKDLTGLEKNVVSLQDKFKALKMIGVGWGLSHIGSSMFGFMGKTVEASKEYTRQLSLMSAAGMSQLEIAKATSSAWQTSKDVITSSASANLTAIRELRSVFGKDHMSEAYAVLPQVQRTKSIMEALTGKEQHGVAFDMVKAIELGTKGAVTKEGLIAQSEMMSKALMQFGGTLTVQDFHQALKYSRSAAPYLSNDFKFKYLPTLIQEMKTGHGGASSAGNVIASLYALVAGRQIPKELISNWQDAGLIKKGFVVADKHNRTTSKILPGGILGSPEFAENPYFWAQNYVAPAIKKLMTTKHLSEVDAYYALTKDRMKAFGLQTLVNKAAQFERDRKLIETGPTSIQSYQKLLKTNPQLAQQALDSQWQNVQARIGYEILPRLIPYMIKFADALDGIGQWMQKHPRQLQLLVGGFVGLGVAMSIVGKVLMAAGFIKLFGLGPALAGLLSPMRLAAAAITGATTAFAAFVAFKVGYMIGTWLNNEVLSPLVKFFSDGKALSLGDWIYQKVHGDGNDALGPTQYKIQNGHAVPVPPKQQTPIQVHSTVTLDGKKVGEAVTKHQAREASRPPTGTSAIDPRMAQLYPNLSSLNYGR